ncbi:ubiquinone biosynthesis O-methyltransferase, mitochondrial [Clupea harengus]|uniref:Ubiquinone biosynthesis O-methyltransferase, mitochondrial n=1 Tax=Clupea harengus TaxID=7950 RepID=A0A6P3VTI8_CLUHA|nr:ubiquinone biosynthesis O-methyltransferase, mitochondrial [Clupea harengus]
MYSKKFGRLAYGLGTETRALCPTNLKGSNPSDIVMRVLSSWAVCKHQRHQFLQRQPHDKRVNQPTTLSKIRPHASSIRQVSHTTLDPAEVKKFQSLADKWWDQQGEFAALHSMNDLRVPFIRDNLLSIHGSQRPGSPLAGLRIMDVGCGGGLLSEPLGRLGADVVGIDPVEVSVRTAELHTSYDPELQKRVQYRACTLEEVAQEEEGETEDFHAVVASEVVEHLADLDIFASCCYQVLKPGGSLFITTISKTNLSYALGIVAAEQLLRIVPSGTHDWEKFITPVDLERLLESTGFQVESIRGMLFNPLSGSWSWTQSTAINYALHAVKRSEEPQPDRARAESEEPDHNEALSRAAAAGQT